LSRRYRLPTPRLFAAVFAAVLLLAGCGGAAQPASPKPSPAANGTAGAIPAQGAANGAAKALTPVTLGVLKLNSSAPIFVGLDKGFFKEQGIDARVKWFTAAEPVAVAVASGSVQVGATGITAGLYNLVASGKKMLIVADKGREQKGYHLNAILVGPKSGITSIAGLKGHTVGVTQIGSTFHYILGNVLAKHGLKLSDIHVKPLGSLTNVSAALEGHQVDAVVTSEPFVDKAVKAGYAKVLAWVSDEMPYQVSAIFYSPAFAADHALAVRFMEAYLKSVRYYDGACLLKGATKATCLPVARIIGKYTGASPATVESALTYIDPNGALIPGDIARQIAWYERHGMVKGKLDAASIVDDSFRLDALRALGKA
jgi:NitT/TauT family transport system substrate-binding protein